MEPKRSLKNRRRKTMMGRKESRSFIGIPNIMRVIRKDLRF